MTTVLFLSESYLESGFFDFYRQKIIEYLALSSDGIVVYAYKTNGDNIGRINNNIKNISPDIIFSINGNGLSPGLSKFIRKETTVIVWVWDSLERFNPGAVDIPRNAHVFLAGKNKFLEHYVTKFKLSPERTFYLPFGFDGELFGKNTDQERSVDVSFVGTAFVFGNVLNKLLFELRNQPGQRNIVLDTYFDHEKEYIFIVKDELVRRGFKFNKLPAGIRNDFNNSGTIQAIFDDHISLSKRIKYLSALSDFKLVIFGEPVDMWINNISYIEPKLLRQFQYSGVDEIKLAGLYNISKCCVNIQHHQAHNFALAMRNFDIMASKALLVTERISSEALSDLGYVEDQDYITYSNSKDLYGKVQYYLQNEKERENIVNSAYLKTIHSHSIQNRVVEIFKTVGYKGLALEIEKIKNLENSKPPNIEYIDKFSEISRVGNHLQVGIRGKPVDYNEELPAASNQISFSVDGLDVVINRQGVYNLWGWAFLRGERDQSQYERFIVLRSNARTYFFPVESARRPDVKEAFSDLKINVLNSGFSTYIFKNALQNGSYHIGVAFRHQSNHEVYYYESQLLPIIKILKNEITLSKGNIANAQAAIIPSGEPVQFDQKLPDTTPRLFGFIKRITPNFVKRAYKGIRKT